MVEFCDENNTYILFFTLNHEIYVKDIKAFLAFQVSWADQHISLLFKKREVERWETDAPPRVKGEAPWSLVFILKMKIHNTLHFSAFSTRQAKNEMSNGMKWMKEKYDGPLAGKNKQLDE